MRSKSRGGHLDGRKGHAQCEGARLGATVSNNGGCHREERVGGTQSEPEDMAVLAAHAEGRALVRVLCQNRIRKGGLSG